MKKTAAKKTPSSVRVRVREKTVIVHQPGEELSLSSKVYESVKSTVERVVRKTTKKGV